ncbi:prolyl-tRNA synthetase [Naegleria gruberi]|uniref:proline--tRNA ligase n=2 Tax=Naegleria gruberi TaxID=5762 RepID=D2V5Y9_NAEGR|nr:prolyl-tRNA synthetase [Naegleria gruberi]EFC47882.1 prolyl-tRNA synthetase [Naegleria gruberi]|eukprot:XP_002680626.1 prolyl-tRNA synthetase [Naegleria gruberi strain NEG-M]
MSDSPQQETPVAETVQKQPREKKVKPPKEPKAPKQQQGSSAAGNKQNEGVDVKKAENFSEWYTQVITKSDFLDYYEVSGCYIFRPNCFYVWEKVQNFFDGHIKKLGVQNVMFPMFVTKRALETEKDHVEGFSPEVAWVTKSGNSDLDEPIALRPTSETIMYPSYAKWIKSHRDLPLKLNQWTNVVRWEFKHAVPFIRSREFYWQEGHSAFKNFEQAKTEVYDILELYKRTYEEILAVPVIKGKKTEAEKFAGADFTTTIEAFIPTNGRAVQAATSHHLGQNFSRMFKIEFEAEDKKSKLVYQNSWGLSTRSLGVMIMVHGDDKGMVLPPRVAFTQVVLIPLYFKNKDNSELETKSKTIFAQLEENGVRIKLDDRLEKTPGWKYNYWELRGVPLRIEIGPKDLENGVAMLCRRDNGEKWSVPLEQLTAQYVNEILDKIHNSMLEKAREVRNQRISVARTWEEFMTALNAGNLVLIPWRQTHKDDVVLEDLSEEERKEYDAKIEEEKKAEEYIKERSKKESAMLSDSDSNTGLTGAAKSLCVPLDQSIYPSLGDCEVFCPELSDRKPNKWALFGRSY